MTVNVAGFGTSIRIVASNTFPIGFEVNQFADDADPIDLPNIEIMGRGMGLNGDLVVWTIAQPIIATINILAGSEDDRNLSLLFDANRVGRNKNSARDTITSIISYPDDLPLTLTTGATMEFPPGRSIASEGRFKSNAYMFAFENRIAL